jgi:HAD superfamily hydrolase (TIGR01549 family)
LKQLKKAKQTLEVSALKAVLFDLDDTLFDHQFSRLKGLAALQANFPELKAASLEELERAHEKLLSADYGMVLDGKLSIVDGTTQRIAKLCSMYGVNLDLEEAKSTADLYSQEYMKNRQPVPGSKDLLTVLKKYAKLGVVSNGLVEPQMEKLRVCQIDKLLDFVVISEAVEYKKPGKEIFEVALKQANVKPSEAVYVGDSWSSDVLPAVSVGMRAVWLNRYGLKCPNPKIAREINSFIDVNMELFLRW